MAKRKIQNLSRSLTRFIVSNRWWLMVVLSGLAILNEAYDHIIVSFPVFQVYEFVRGMIMYGLILPVSGGILLGLLKRAESERMTAVTTMNQEESLSHQIAQSSNWKELVGNIAAFPSHFLPVAVSVLYVVNRSEDRLEYGSGWSEDPAALVNFPTELPLSQCTACRIRTEGANQLTSCTCNLCAASGSSSGYYCMPFTYANQLVGLIYMRFPVSMTVPLHQVKIFTRMAPEISLALDRAILQRSMLNQAAVNESERRKIAQDLHDSLAQNIGYLRLKLDQLTGEDAISEITEIRNDLNRMKDIADQSYEQVRETLTHLRPKDTGDLVASLQNFAKVISDRSGIVLQFENSGRPLPIPLSTYRQITFICQEALVNIEKHAQAKEIEMDLIWAEESLTVKISDNGMGFAPSAGEDPGHYGMAIMKERAEEIHARLEILSSPLTGTTVQLSVPIQRNTTDFSAETMVNHRFQNSSLNQSTFSK
jgi:signal transduction histidine kinase